MLILLVLLSFLMDSSHNLPANRMKKMAISEPSPHSTRMTSHSKRSQPSKRSTIRSSFTPLTTKRTAKPMNLREPVDPIPPVTPISHADVEARPATLHVMSATPLKPMSSLEDITTAGPLNPDFYEPGCICCCHENVIHEPAPPREPMLLPQLKTPCSECCKCKCDNCTLHVCKSDDETKAPCISCGEGCLKSKPDPTFSITNSSLNPVNCQPCICNADSKIIDRNCLRMKKLPPCSTKCNNNYLGYNLQNGREDVKQPTTRTFSTTQLAPKYIKFTDTTAQAEAGYNPIQPMPTIPSMNSDDDVIIHHIMVAQPMAPPLDITQIPSDYMFLDNHRQR